MNFSSISSINVQNISYMVPTKLKRDNYLFWKALFAPIFRRYKLIGIIDGFEISPPPVLLDQSGVNTSIPNLELRSGMKRMNLTVYCWTMSCSWIEKRNEPPLQILNYFKHLLLNYSNKVFSFLPLPFDKLMLPSNPIIMLLRCSTTTIVVRFFSTK